MSINKRWYMILMFGLMVLFPAVSFAAGSCTFAKDTTDRVLTKFTWVCTADGAGDVSSPTITGNGATQKISGPIWYVKITPGTGGDAPDALYDVELRDSADANDDVLRGLGDNLSQTLPTIDIPVSETNGIGVILHDQVLTPYAATCGASSKFTIMMLVYTAYKE